jgi:hypothetical protein
MTRVSRGTLLGAFFGVLVAIAAMGFFAAAEVNKGTWLGLCFQILGVVFGLLCLPGCVVGVLAFNLHGLAFAILTLLGNSAFYGLVANRCCK